MPDTLYSKTLRARVPQTDQRKVARIAKKRRVKISVILREAIEQYLERQG